MPQALRAHLDSCLPNGHISKTACAQGQGKGGHNPQQCPRSLPASLGFEACKHDAQDPLDACQSPEPHVPKCPHNPNTPHQPCILLLLGSDLG